MKVFKKTSEIIDYARSFHIKMKEFYEQLNEHTDNQKVKLFLDYLISHEKHCEETLEEYTAEAPSYILNSWYKYVPENMPDNCLKNFVFDPDMNIDDVIVHALRLNNCLTEMYKGLAEEAASEEIKELFQDLMNNITKEEKNLVRDGAMWNEM